jgi:hypothetical protein
VPPGAIRAAVRLPPQTEVAVSAVKLDAVEACVLGALGGFAVVVDDGWDFVDVEGAVG